jgi:hypothetical protein
MATVYAIFPSGSKLEEAMERLRLGGDAEVIPPRDLESDASGNYAGEGSDAVIPPVGAASATIGSSGRAMVPATAVLAGELNRPERRLDGLSEDARRIFDNALQNGSHVLVVGHADPDLEQRLRELGAEQVAHR